MTTHLSLPKVGEPFNPREQWKVMEGFTVPFEIAAMLGLSSTAKLVYGLLRWRAGVDGLCFPSQRHMAEAIGADGTKDSRKKTIRRALQELVQASLIRLESRTFHSGQKTTNLVIFLWHPSFEKPGRVADKRDPYHAGRVPDKNDPYPGLQNTEGSGQKRERRRGQKRPEGGDMLAPYVPDKSDPTVNNNKETSSSNLNKENSKRELLSLTTPPPSAPEAEPRVPNSDFPDDDDSLRGPWANPDEELKAIFRHKAGEQIPIFLLDQIRSDLASNGVEMADFVAEIRKHLKGNWLNPPAFIRSRSKGFRRLTRTVAAMTAAEAEAKRIAAEEAGYRCALCGSRKRGEGLIMAEGNMIPCACASPEYIAHQIERGVLKAAGAAA